MPFLNLSRKLYVLRMLALSVLLLFAGVPAFSQNEISCFVPSSLSQVPSYSPLPSPGPYLLVLGDSNSASYGTASRWPGILSEIIGLPVFNAAKSGAIAGGENARDSRNPNDPIGTGLIGETQLARAEVLVPPDKDVIVLISLGGNDLTFFNDTPLGVIADLEELRIKVQASPVFSSTKIYFVELAPLIVTSPIAQRIAESIQQVNNYLAQTYPNNFIRHTPGIENYLDLLHFNATEHRHRAQLIKSFLMPTSDSWDSDTDRDGLTDGQELLNGTLVNDSDSDDDGVSDGRETELGTNPLNADTDGDLLLDGTELGVHLPLIETISACSYMPIAGSASSVFIPDMCPGHQSNPLVSLNLDGLVATGATDQDRNGCFERGQACTRVELVTAKATTIARIKALQKIAYKIAYLPNNKISARKSCRATKANRKKSHKSVASITKILLGDLQSLPQIYDQCINFSGLECSHVDTSALVSQLGLDILNLDRQSKKTLSCLSSSTQKAYKKKSTLAKKKALIGTSKLPNPIANCQ